MAPSGPEALTESIPGRLCAPGRVLADRYRIRERLGSGGMGEVWLAHDLKLRVEVALKSLFRERFSGRAALELLRREVRAAREVISPNVCRIFDLVTVGDQELVSMEYIDGWTLLDLLRRRSPLQTDEATGIALQLLAGLEAIHQAGLVHRDVKPENVMLTRAGRVVVMDLGLVRPADTVAATVAGTPAYMAPEQRRGDPVDARADVFAMGVLLAEMTTPPGIRNQLSRQRLWADLHQEPPRLAEGPWRAVLERALCAQRTRRFASAAQLARALEGMSRQVGAVDHRKPYPGLAAFTEAEAEFFFGREAEVESVWKKLDRPHLLAMIGPSGAGKSSFLRAGLIPAAPEGWGHLICHPGDGPFRALAQALVPELSSDNQAMRRLLDFEQPQVAVQLLSGWRRRHGQALLVIDQFEELFTLNPPEVQERFAKLLGRLPLEADIHVLLSLRDDFLIFCHDHEALAPAFVELTPLKALTGSSLRRALVQPALKCGYRFENENLVQQMVDEVDQERGALPLLAFAAARLWEERDRDRGRLTREAYRRIGGVGGALAQHAEATLGRVGSEHQPMVRELFRNLVTPEGTRAARSTEELLSVFDDQQAAQEVLRVLVDARLLTSFEIATETADQPIARVEIIHESLLEAWPRLVRWRARDAEGARLRGELQQAARVWEQHDRADDFLWTGSAFREYQLWREHYPGGITPTEKAFGQAMTRRAESHKRRRRLALAAVIVILLAVLAVVGVSRQQAVDEARRAEASKLLALGRLEMDDYPTAALAYSLASLELSDQPPARRLALEALWRGPPASLLGGGRVWRVAFSPDGEWLAAGKMDGTIGLWSRRGGEARSLAARGAGILAVDFGAASERLAAADQDGTLHVWRVPDGELLRTLKLGADHLGTRLAAEAGELITFRRDDTAMLVGAWPLDGGASQPLGRVPAPRALDVDRKGARLAVGVKQTVSLLPLDALTGGRDRVLGTHDAEILHVVFDRDGRRVAAIDADREIRIWSAEERENGPLRTLQGRHETTGSFTAEFNARGSAFALTRKGQTAWLWQLDAPADAEPLGLRKGSVFQFNDVDFDPSDRWLATADHSGVALWPLARHYASVVRRSTSKVWSLAVAPDASWVASSSQEVAVAPLAGAAPRRAWRQHVYRLAARPDGRYLLGGRADGKVSVLPLGGGEPRLLSGFSSQVWAVAWSPDGRLAAAGGGQMKPEDGVIRVWDVETGELVRVLDPGDGEWVGSLAFVSERQLVSASGSGVRSWDLDDGTSTLLRAWNTAYGHCAISGDRRRLITVGYDFDTNQSTEIVVHDLETGASRALASHGRHTTFSALDATGTLAATTDIHGVVRIGPTTGEDPHLLLGHEGPVWDLAFTPDGRQLLTAGEDGTIRVWPRPEGPPFHTLPHDVLIERLRSLTNLRAVRDEEAASGYRLSAGPFAGWETVPTW